MRYFLDTEFYDDGKSLELISIGIVNQFDDTYYAINSDFEESHFDPWLTKNVKKYFPERSDPVWKPKSQIRDEIKSFITVPFPQFWCDFGSWDWVIFCHIFGKMLDVPEGYPNHCLDVQQWRIQSKLKHFPIVNTSKHHALADAKECKAKYDFLERLNSGKVKFGEVLDTIVVNL